MSDKSASSAARGAWMASGLTFFAVGVVFSLTMPDNIALGITFLSVGVVFFSLAGSKRAPGDGSGEPPTDPPADPAADPAAAAAAAEPPTDPRTDPATPEGVGPDETDPRQA